MKNAMRLRRRIVVMADSASLMDFDQTKESKVFAEQ